MLVVVWLTAVVCCFSEEDRSGCRHRRCVGRSTRLRYGTRSHGISQDLEHACIVEIIATARLQKRDTRHCSEAKPIFHNPKLQYANLQVLLFMRSPRLFLRLSSTQFQYSWHRRIEFAYLHPQEYRSFPFVDCIKSALTSQDCYIQLTLRHLIVLEQFIGERFLISRLHGFAKIYQQLVLPRRWKSRIKVLIRLESALRGNDILDCLAEANVLEQKRTPEAR